MRLALRLVLGLMLGLLALVVSVVCFALFPPSDLLRRAVIPVARQVLNHPNLDVGYLKLRPLSEIEIRDIWLGPPAGYSRPMCTVKRIVVRHDLRQIQGGLIRVEQVQVERPFLTVEHRGGKLNWVAFLEGLPKSEPTPEDKTPSEPSSLRILIDRVALIGIGADVDDGAHRARLDSLHLALWGMITPERTDAHLTLELESPRRGQPSVSLLQRAPTGAHHSALQSGSPRPRTPKNERTGDLGAELETNLRLELRATQRPVLRQDLKPDIRACVNLDLNVASRSIQAPWTVPPVTLQARLSAEADTMKDQARLHQLQLSLNQAELLRLKGALAGLFKPRQMELLLSRLHLPLDRLAPYLRAVEPGLDVGGDVELRGLKLVSDLDGARLPVLGGTITLRKVRATMKRGNLSLKDLDMTLALSTRPAAGVAPTPAAVLAALPSLSDKPEPPRQAQGVQVHGHIQLGLVRAAGAVIHNLDLRLAAGADLRGLSTLQAFASKVHLRVPRLHVHHPKLGPVGLGLNIDLNASGDWRRKLVRLNQLRVELPELLGLRLTGLAEELGQRRLALELQLEPAPLARLLARLPAGLRRQLQGRQASGRVTVGLKVAGRLPKTLSADPARLLELPVTIGARIGLQDVGLEDRVLGLSLRRLNGEITCDGRPSDLRLATDLQLAAVTKQDLKLSVEQLRLPLAVHFTPRQLEARIGLSARRLTRTDMGLVTTGLQLDLQSTTAVPPLSRLLARGTPPLGRTHLTLKHGTAGFRMAVPGNHLRTGPIENRLELTYDPAVADSVHLTLNSGVAWLTQKEQRARLRGLSVAGTFAAALPVQRLIGGGPAAMGRASGRLTLGLDELRLATPGNNLSGERFGVVVELDHDPNRPEAVRAATTVTVGTLDHDQQQVRVCDLKLVERSAVRGIVLRLPQPVIKLDRVDNHMRLELGSVHRRGLHTLKRTTLELDAELTRELKDAHVRRLSLRLPSNGVRLDLTGKAGGLLPFSPRKLPELDLMLEAGLVNPKADGYGHATFLLPGLRTSGKAGLKLHVRGGGQPLELDARLLATAFNLWSARGAIQREKDGSSLTIATRVHVRDLNMDLPLSQSITLDGRGGVTLPRPQGSIFERSETGNSVLQSTLRPYGGRRSAMSLGGVQVKQEIIARDPAGKLQTTIRRTLGVDRIAMDLAIRDSSVFLDRFYLKLFDGDIAGSMQAQLLGLRPGQIPDVRLQLKMQVTGVNLAHLDPAATRRGADTEVSALLDLRAEPYRESVEGRINITRLSLKMLDSLLAYLDPNNVNQSVRENRKLINSWYFKLVNPKVKLISIWINHGNLNMDIEMNTIAGVNALVQRNLRQNSVRRLDILPFLRDLLGPAVSSGDE